MDKEELRQYRYLKKEIRHLKSKMAKVSKRNIVTDSVVGSSPEFPYENREIKIRGLAQKPTKELQRLQNRIDKATAQADKIKAWIDSISDARTRLIFEMYYVDGENFSNISYKLGSAHESYARKIHDKYLDENIG